ncbi:hypothetical protein TNCT_302581 [Trichonephila clavata]|uniref:Transposase n=1 Tax=Trichonephila clavata TaxID=2740835 RepID=A0A8X6F2T7_TRICU|nr:hypothetical protein TNCT_302581 [Trichonephila clavata]
MPGTIVDNKVLRKVVGQNPGNTIRDLAEELRSTPTTILCYLKIIQKVKKTMDKWVPPELSKNKKNNKRFETSSALFLRNQNDPFLNRYVNSVRQLVTFIAVDGCQQSSTTLPDTKTPSKEGYGGYLMVLSQCLTYSSFLKPYEIITVYKYRNAPENCI